MKVRGIMPGGGIGLRGVALAGAAACCFAPIQARAQAPGTGFGATYSANANKPVDIESDTLEVDDKKKTAIFKGSVSATQGDINLKSNEIYVTYTSGPATKTASAGTADASPLGAGGNITQIDAKGDVFVTMNPDKPDKQTAKSDWAIFDVPKQIITLGCKPGGMVELSRGQKRENVIVGNKLVVNVAEGTSHFENSGSGSGAAGRMRAILTPPPKDKDKKNEGAN